MTVAPVALPAHNPTLVRERLQKFFVRQRERGRPWSQAAVAKAVGKSSALISPFLNETPRGDVQDLCTRLLSFLDQQDAKEKAGDATLPFVDIRQARLAMEALNFAAVHQEMVAIIGDSGRGKSSAIGEFRRLNPQTVLIEASRIHGPSAVLQDLCFELGDSDKGLLRALLKRIVYRLNQTPRLIIVDDAHTLGFASLDILRTVYDRTGVGMVLAGISKLELLLAGTTPETEQLARRVIFRRRLPEYVEADAEQQLAGLLPHLDAGEVLEHFDPRAKSSPARLTNVIKLACKLAGGADRVKVQHIKSALAMVA